jgi:hypothetical protein
VTLNGQTLKSNRNLRPMWCKTEPENGNNFLANDWALLDPKKRVRVFANRFTLMLLLSNYDWIRTDSQLNVACLNRTLANLLARPHTQHHRQPLTVTVPF